MLRTRRRTENADIRFCSVLLTRHLLLSRWTLGATFFGFENQLPHPSLSLSHPAEGEERQSAFAHFYYQAQALHSHCAGKKKIITAHTNDNARTRSFESDPMGRVTFHDSSLTLGAIPAWGEHSGKSVNRHNVNTKYICQRLCTPSHIAVHKLLSQ